MQIELTKKENKLIKVFQEHPSEFLSALYEVTNDPCKNKAALTEKEVEFLNCVKADPERAFEILQKILDERKNRSSETC
ncbi:MAG: hypothetical protein IKL18_00085 [Oscillospiraceae bacterium]|nr:hypothetical protein [Oscillospiraceae bacterium]